MIWQHGVGSAAALSLGPVFKLKLQSSDMALAAPRSDPGASGEVTDILCQRSAVRRLQLPLRSCTGSHPAPPAFHSALGLLEPGSCVAVPLGAGELW